MSFGVAFASLIGALGHFARQIAIPKTVKRFPPNLWIFLWKTWVDGGRLGRF